MEIERAALRPSTPGDTNHGYSSGDSVDPERPAPLHDPAGQRHFGDDDEVDRPSNMWIASAYNITAIVGIGVLGLPQALVFLTWGPGVVILLLAFFITYFTMKQLTMLHEFEVIDNKKIRYETCYKLGQRAFGPRRGLWVILTLQMVVEVSFDILFTVAAGEAMNRVYDNHSELCEAKPVHMFAWFAVFAAIQILLSLTKPTFESIRWIVVIAAIMSICYSSIAWITVLSVGGPKEQGSGFHNIPVNYTLPKHLLVDHCVPTVPEPGLNLNHTDLIFRACNALGVVAFAYAAHNVILEIQNGLSSTPNKSSAEQMLRGVIITYAVVAICYLPMGIAFYKTYGNQISENALSFLQYQTKAPRAAINATNIMLIFHLIVSYQIFGIPVFNLLEKSYTTKIKPKLRGCPPLIEKSISHLIRPLYIVLTAILAMIFPYFSPLIGFFGGLAMAPTTFFLPCIIWLVIKKPKTWSTEWWKNWISIVLGVLLMISATIGGAYVLIKEFKSDKYYRLWTHDWPNTSLYLTSNLHNSTLISPTNWTTSILNSRCNYSNYINTWLQEHGINVTLV